jgi:hypothetical protein
MNHLTPITTQEWQVTINNGPVRNVFHTIEAANDFVKQSLRALVAGWPDIDPSSPDPMTATITVHVLPVIRHYEVAANPGSHMLGKDFALATKSKARKASKVRK